MLVYYFMILAVVLFTYAAHKIDSIWNWKFGQQKRPGFSRFFLILTAMTLAIVAGLRYNIGSDFGAYYKARSIFGGHLWESVISLNEPFTALFTDVITLFSEDNAAYILCFSLFTVLTSCYVIFRDSEKPLFAIMLYIFCGCWHGSFNGVRQFFAATFILLGYKYIYTREFWKYAFFVFLAYCSHVTAIIMIVPYFFLTRRVNFLNILLLAIGTIIVGANYETIFGFIGMLKDENVTMNAYASNSVNVMRILVNCAPAIMMIVFYIMKKEPFSRMDDFYTNILVMNAAAMVAASNSAYLARIGIYTNILLPVALTRLIRFRSKPIEIMLRLTIIVLYAAFWYIEVSGAPALNNFRWVWERTA